MPATSACPICGGELKHSELRFHGDIVFCDSGAVSLSPVQSTIVKALMTNPAGLDTQQLGERIGMNVYGISAAMIRARRKLESIGWGVPNIGCGGRGGALYVLKRKW